MLEILTNNIVISEDEIDLMEEVCYTIKTAPALDVAPVVHAYWKKTYDLIDGHDGYECSACGYTKYFDHYAEGIALCKPFCCECCARMDGEADDAT